MGPLPPPFPNVSTHTYLLALALAGRPLVVGALLLCGVGVVGPRGLLSLLLPAVWKECRLRCCTREEEEDGWSVGGAGRGKDDAAAAGGEAARFRLLALSIPVGWVGCWGAGWGRGGAMKRRRVPNGPLPMVAHGWGALPSHNRS